jgi:positive phototaxis protein PixI
MNLTSSSPTSPGSLVTSKAGAIAPAFLKQYIHSHLKFKIGSHTALLPTHQVLEAITLPVSSVTPMPNMPPAMLGLVNRRSQVLWVTDLALLLGIPVAYPNSQHYHLILVQIHDVIVALRVQEINSIVSLPPEQVSPVPAHVSTDLAPFLRGCWLQGNEVLLVLSAEAILRAPALQPT